MESYKIQQHKYDVIVIGAGGAGLRATFGRGPVAVVVRPDGHVAAVVDGADPGGLVAALDRTGVLAARPVGARR